MSTGVRVQLSEAKAIADELVTILGLGCERIEIAGSIRRGRRDVGDIELVAVPLMERVPDGLFEEREISTLDLLIDTLILQGDLWAHPTDPKRGEKYTKLLHRSGLQVDLFTARPETFGLILLIRTGPADYSRAFVTDLRKIGWHVAHGELHRGGLSCPTGGCQLVPTPEERDVYRLVGHPWVEPRARDGLARLIA